MDKTSGVLAMMWFLTTVLLAYAGVHLVFTETTLTMIMVGLLLLLCAVGTFFMAACETIDLFT